MRLSAEVTGKNGTCASVSGSMYNVHQRQCCNVSGDMALIVLLRFLNKPSKSLQINHWRLVEINHWCCRNQPLTLSRNQPLMLSRNQPLTLSRNQPLTLSRNQPLTLSRNGPLNAAHVLSLMLRWQTKCTTFSYIAIPILPADAFWGPFLVS